jgi:DNA topoisomerase II
MTDKYEKIDQIEHIHLRPDMYVGSLKPKKFNNEWISNSKHTKITKTNSIKYSDGLVRIFVEAISNAIDNVWRSKDSNNTCKNIKITINKETGLTSIWNDGMCIPIEKNVKTNLYNPELIFGHLLTSSNYDDSKDRYTSGRNGLGIKLTNVFSKEFIIDVSDGNKKYTKTWSNNMRDSGNENITNCKKKGYTQVSWIPDFEKFKMSGYDNNIIRIYNKIVLDTAMITKVNVFLNDEKIQIKSLLDYAKLFGDNNNYISMKSSDCEVVITNNDEHEEYEFIPFSNGVFNKDGGIHVDKWTEDIFRPILNKLNKPNKPHITLKDVKKFFRIFINCTVKNPEFTSQSKTCLSHPQVETNVTGSNITNIMKWDVFQNVKDIIKGKELLSLKKTESKSRKFKKIDGLDPANNAGSKHSNDCTLILCEGLSAKTFAVSGIQIGWNGKKGRDWFGAYALRGKLLNVRNSNIKSISNNKEITDLVNALNLKYDVDYTEDKYYNTLNYGRVMIMTDADHDGIHIASLILNLFHFLFPSLLKRENPYIVSMQTPIVKILNKNLLFYREEHYQKYLQENEGNKLKIKYYKGLGTNSDKEIKDTFGKYVIKFNCDDDIETNMNLVFNNKQSDDRKKWMTNYVREYPPENIGQMSISDYLNKEQIKFSLNDCGRSLPNVYDGMKESHRKILYGIFLKNCKDSIKVAQLAGFVAEKTNYHHGEQNLFDTITKLAQDYVGSNNIPYLEKDGQFGTRLMGGKDAANARYIFTKLSKITRILFPKQDDVLLNYVYDEGEKVEPKYYLPIIPTILVNGCKAGIGTGWSTSIPCYNPSSIIEYIINYLNEDELPNLHPYYKGFNGSIKKKSKFVYESEGLYVKDGKKITITELPVMTWTDKYKEFLEGLLENKKVKSFRNYSTPEKVHFEIVEGDLKLTKNNLKLVSTISTSNMVLFTDDNKLRKFKNIGEILSCFIKKRYELYVLRKKSIIKTLINVLKELNTECRFIKLVIDDMIVMFKRSDDDIIKDLEKYKFETMNDGYDYLLNIKISKFTKVNVEKLEENIKEVREELEKVRGTSEKEMWIRELRELKESI